MSVATIVTDRNIWVTSPLPAGQLVLETFSGHEALGNPFGFDLALVSRNPGIDLGELLGKPMTVHVALTAGERQFSGIVVHAENASTDGDMTRYRVTLAPWLSLLQYTTNCRIFQNQSVVDIVKAVFRDNDFSDFEDALTETYPPLDYCVQYRESDYNFVSRLLEGAGIYYYFKHQDGKHVLVLADGFTAHKTVPGYEQVPYKPQQRNMDDSVERIESWVVSQQVRSGSFAATDFDFTRPRVNLLSRLQAPLGNAADSYALFDYPGKFLKAADGNQLVKIRLQEAQVAYQAAEASGNPRGLGAGHLFSLVDFPRDDENKEYLIVTASYSFHTAVFETGATAGGDEVRASFRLIDSQTPFRPALTSHKPRVDGPQTAIVVGEQGEEITTDKYGRVKVQFHWDREGKSDQDSSCWVRVAQVWAGSSWGAMHIPRIGQEVIVEFLEGDPDRPIITGRVYNADNMPPYALPENKTQSGIKSRSTKGAGPANFNEIRFEDKKGSEELHIQAEKDQSTHVKNNRSADVGANDSISVGGDRSVTVNGNLSVTVKGGGKSPNHSNLDVTGKHHVHASDTIEIDAPTHIKLTCGDSFLLIEPGKITLTSGGKATVVLDANVLAKANGGAQILLDPNVLVKSNAGSKVVLDANALVKSSGGAQVQMDSNILAQAAGGGNVTIDGTKIQIAGQAEVNVSAGSGTIKASAPGVEIDGAMVKING